MIIARYSPLYVCVLVCVGVGVLVWCCCCLWQLFPALVLGAPLSFLATDEERFLIAVTCEAAVSIWCAA